jgi:hypothetical protein
MAFKQLPPEDYALAKALASQNDWPRFVNLIDNLIKTGAHPSITDIDYDLYVSSTTKFIDGKYKEITEDEINVFYWALIITEQIATDRNMHHQALLLREIYNMNPQFNFVKEKYIDLINFIEEHILGGKKR